MADSLCAHDISHLKIAEDEEAIFPGKLPDGIEEKLLPYGEKLHVWCDHSGGSAECARARLETPQAVRSRQKIRRARRLNSDAPAEVFDVVPVKHNIGRPVYVSPTIERTGSRSKNMDAHGCVETEQFVMRVLADGHIAKDRSRKMTEIFCAEAFALLQSRTFPYKEPKDVGMWMFSLFQKAMELSEDCKGGTTFCVFLLDLELLYVHVLNLGDSGMLMGNPTTGEIIMQDPIWYVDTSSSDRSWSGHEQGCVTTMHSADNAYELIRYRNAFPASRVEAITRPGTTPIEARKLIHVDGKKIGVEPTRTVERIVPEKLSDPVAKKLLKLQRFPELLCWQAPKTSPFCVMQFCDGLFSHNAFPNPAAMFRLLANPWNVVVDSNKMLKDTFVGIHMEKQMRDLPPVQRLEAMLPWVVPSMDAAWIDAYKPSHSRILQACKLQEKGVPLPSLMSRTEEALEFCADWAILMLSDDNISVNATLVG